MLSQENYPRSINDFLNTAYPAGKIGLANPSFGSNASHAAAIYTLIGVEKGRAFYQSLKDRDVNIIEGNAMVRDMVVSGQLMFGLMDTDDAEGAIRDKASVSIIFPDQDSTGTLVLPNTISLIKSAPHPATARKLIDYLLSKDVEKALTEAGWSHIPLRPVGAKPQYIDAANVKSLKISLQDIYANLKYVQKDMPDIFMR
jgi:iron(III) transport system substrate-binding protein